MSQRIVVKQLAGQEDLIIGEALVQQERAGGTYPVTGLRMFGIVNSIAELDTLDPTNFPKATVVQDFAITFYEYDDGNAEYKKLNVETAPALTGKVVDQTLSDNSDGVSVSFSSLTGYTVTHPATVELPVVTGIGESATTYMVQDDLVSGQFRVVPFDATGTKITDSTALAWVFKR